MTNLQNYLINVPELFTQIVAWSTPAIALMIAYFAERKFRYESSLLVLSSLKTSLGGVTTLVINNIGSRAAVDVQVRLDVSTVVAVIDGLGAGKQIDVDLARTPQSPANVRIEWLDANRKLKGRNAKFVLDNQVWRLQVR